MSALDRARTLWDGEKWESAVAAALISIAESLEVIAECQSEQRAEARWYFEQNEGDPDLFGGRYRPTAEVRSPLLMDVREGHDDGADHGGGS